VVFSGAAFSAVFLFSDFFAGLGLGAVFSEESGFEESQSLRRARYRYEGWLREFLHFNFEAGRGVLEVDASRSAVDVLPPGPWGAAEGFLRGVPPRGGGSAILGSERRRLFWALR